MTNFRLLLIFLIIAIGLAFIINEVVDIFVLAITTGFENISWFRAIGASCALTSYLVLYTINYKLLTRYDFETFDKAKEEMLRNIEASKNRKEQEDESAK